jgi:hypothetical protein
MSDMEKPSQSVPEQPVLIEGEAARVWLQAKLKRAIPPYVPAQVMRFSRYSSDDDAVVVMPEGFAAELGELRPERNKPDQKATALGEGGGYQPPKRVRSGKPSRRDGVQCVIEKTSAREILLSSTPTRSSHWGMDLRRLVTGAFLTVEHYAEVAGQNGFGHQPYEHGEDALLLLRGAFALGLAQTRLQPPGHTTMRLPLIHNQQDGQRYILQADRKSLGSPAMLHILAYPNEAPPPRLRGWTGVPRPEPAERKSGLLLHASTDKRIRFYFPTRDQWAEWRASKLEIEKLPPEIAPHVSAAIAAAERIAAKLGYPSV